MGIPEEDAKHFDQGFQAGGILVTVSAGDRAEEARQCLYDSGADLGSMGRGLSGTAGATAGSAGRTGSGTMSTSSGSADRR